MYVLYLDAHASSSGQDGIAQENRCWSQQASKNTAGNIQATKLIGI